MDLLLNGKLALVTGSTAGIGIAIAEGLAREGSTVIVNGRSEARAAKAVEDIRQKIPQAKVEAFSILSLLRKSATTNGEDFSR